MAGTLFALPKQVPLDNGDVVPAGKLYFYLTGTSTPANVYTTPALDVAHSNPVEADSEGVFPPIYLNPSVWQYRVKLTDSSGVQIYQVDTVPSAEPVYARTAAEIAAGVTPTDYSIPHHLALGGIVLPERYGFVYDYSSHNTARDNALLVAEQIQGRIGLNGAMYFSTDLVLPRNVGFIGMGPNYGGQLVPTGSARIKIQGALVTGGWAFRNAFESLAIDSSQTTAANTIDIDTAYNITFRDVLMSGQGTNSANVRGMKVATCNDLVLDNVVMRGYSPTFAGQYAVELGNSVSSTLIACDIESVNRCLYLNGSCIVDVFGGYFERYSAYCVYVALTSGGSLNLFGGDYVNVNSGATAIFVASGSSNVNIHAPKITLNSGKGIESTAATLVNANIYGVSPGDISDSHNALRRYGGTNISGVWERELFNKKTQTDNTATAHYKAYLASGSLMSCELEISAALGGGYAKKILRRQFLITCPAGTAQISTVQSVGTDVSETSSGNYDITITVGSSLSTNSCEIQITADTTGALGNGQSCDVFTRLKVLSGSATSYIDVS